MNRIIDEDELMKKYRKNKKKNKRIEPKFPMPIVDEDNIEDEEEYYNPIDSNYNLIDLEETTEETDVYKLAFGESMSTEENEINEWDTTGWIGFFHLDWVLSVAIDEGASDVHINANQLVCFTKNGDIIKKDEFVMPSEDIMSYLVLEILSYEQKSNYAKDLNLDCSYKIKKGPYKGRRFRLNVGKSFGTDYLCFRVISDEIPMMEELGIDKEIQSWFKRGNGIVLVSGKTGSGKALHKDTIIPTKNGHKTIETIEIGDIIFDKNGKQTKVIDKYSPNSKRFFEITLDSKKKIKSADNHLWVVNDVDNEYLYDTETLYNHFQEDKVYSIKKNKSCEYDYQDVEINPYFYGKILANEDNVVLLKKYKFVSKEQKIHFLTGIYDSKGYYVEFNGEFTFDCKRQDVVEYVYEICNSLGFECSPITKSDRYIFTFVPTIELPLQKGLNKNLHTSNLCKDKEFYINIIDIKEINDNKEDYYCLAVDSPTKTFLCTNEYIVTHNTTTLASLLRNMQMNTQKKIITVEKPIEYEYNTDEGLSLVIQREISTDCVTFHEGLTAAMRQAPDVILIGEVRDREEVEELLRASETGHLAVSTIHTMNVATTFGRIKSLFEGNEQKRVLNTLADTLVGTMNQILVKDKKGGRFAIREILTVNEETREYINNGDSKSIRDYLRKHNRTLEQQLIKNVIEGNCLLEEAENHVTDTEYFEELCKEHNLKS